MDWCNQHPRYSAKRQPNSICGRCWSLWFLRNPEDKLENQGLRDEPLPQQKTA